MLVARPRAAGRVRRAARPRRAVAADHDVHRPRASAARRSASSARSPAPARAIGLLLGGILTEYLSWRWCLYVNLLFASRRRVGALALLRNQAAPAARRASTSPARSTASAGLFALVYGFSQRRDARLGRPADVRLRSAAGVVLLVAFVCARSAASRTRCCRCGWCSTATAAAPTWPIGISGAGMFGVFLFLTYYLQQTLGFSPIETGLAFLPMIGRDHGDGDDRDAPSSLPRVGAAAAGHRRHGCSPRSAMLLPRPASASTPTYAAHVLPRCSIMGVGLGLIFAPAMSTATLGVEPADAGVASAMVNTSQQVGGSIGTALLSTLAASAATELRRRPRRSPALAAQAAVHGYTTAFWWSAAIFAVGAIVTALLLRSGAPAERRPASRSWRTDST